MPERVIVPSVQTVIVNRLTLSESRSLGVERKLGGNLHPQLNINERTIVNKYHEGKLKSTSKGELKDLKPHRGKRLLVIYSVGSPLLWINFSTDD